MPSTKDKKNQFEKMICHIINMAENDLNEFWADDVIKSFGNNPTKKQTKLLKDYNDNKLFDYQLIFEAEDQELIKTIKVVWENDPELNAAVKSVLTNLYPKRLKKDDNGMLTGFDIAKEVLYLTEQFDKE